MLINLELLRTFVDAAQAKTFAAAAARRHVTPSAVSQQISALETQLGIELFERAGRNVRLREEGRRLLTAIEEGLTHIDEALASVVEAHQRVRGEVRIGGPGPFSRMWLRPRLVELLRAHEELVLEVRFDVPSVLQAKLLAGELDLAILVSPTDAPGIAQHVVYVEEFVAVCAREYLKREGTPQSASDYAAHRFLVFDRDLAMHAAWWRASFGRRAPLPPRIACRIGSLDELLALAKLGLGIAVLPNYFVAESLAQGEIVRLEAKGSKRAPKNPISLAWRRGAVETARFRVVRDMLLAGSA